MGARASDAVTAPESTEGPRGGDSRRTGVDFDVRGIVAVRLLDASPGDVAAVRAQLGLPPTTLSGDPDIVIRFVESVATQGTVRYLGVGDAAYTDDAFLVLRGKAKTRTRVAVPLERAGRTLEIVSERGGRAVPLLVPLVNLRALAKGYVPLHASAFLHGKTGIVVTGWTKGGKTETLLAFMRQGARYVGDEWIYVAPDGQRVCGLPEPIRLWKWHLEQLPGYRDVVPAGKRARLSALDASVRLGRAASRRFSPTRAVAALERQLHVDVPPADLFGADRIEPHGALDRLFLVLSADSGETAVAPGDPEDVARRMVQSLQYERRDLAEAYAKFRFAFPDRRSEAIETAAAKQGELLERAFAGKPTYVVTHPYPFRFADVFTAMEPYC